MNGSDLLVVLIGLSALGAGLIGGVFYAFSTFVMKALHRRPAAEGIAAMQSINRVVLTPAFLGVFTGLVPLTAAVAIWTGLTAAAVDTRWAVAGAALYIVGCFGVTVVCNVPMNNALEKIVPDAPGAAAVWNDYVARWTRWNHVRTAASLASSAVFMAMLR